MFTKLLTKALSVIVFTSLTGNCLNSDFSTLKTTYEYKQPEIIETTPIEPDVITLLKDEIRYTQNWNDRGEDTTIQVTQYEAYLLMSIASVEALNQGREGMLKVMQTIINRVNSPEFPNTIYDVVSQPGQFSSFTSGAYLKAEITPEVHMALAELEMNKNHDDNLIAFESSSSGSLLLFFDFYETYKDHVFYQLRGE